MELGYACSICDDQKKFLYASLLLIALASFAFAFAVDLNGTWKGNLASPNGDLETTMVLTLTAKN